MPYFCLPEVGKIEFSRFSPNTCSNPNKKINLVNIHLGDSKTPFPALSGRPRPQTKISKSQNPPYYDFRKANRNLEDFEILKSSFEAMGARKALKTEF